MKNLYFFFAICFAITSYSQDSKVTGNGNVYDANGFPKSLEKTHNTSTNYTAKTNHTSDFGYGDTRPLTEINNPTLGDGYPWISGDGLRLYYCSGQGASDNLIYYTERPNVNSPFQAPSAVPLNVAAPMSIWLSENELEAYVTTYSAFGGKLFYFQRNSTALPFDAPEEISLNGISLGFISGASLNAAQNELFIFSEYDGIILFNRTGANSFEYSGLLFSLSNSNSTPGQISKDDLSYFWGLRNTNNTLIHHLDRSNTADSFSSSVLQEINTLNELGYLNFQPSMSTNLEWVVFVRNPQNTWYGNELYISHNQALSVANPKANSFIIVPNPTSGKFVISLPSSFNAGENYEVQIYDATTKLLFKKQMATEIDLTSYLKGVYFAKIQGTNFVEVQKIIRN